MIERVQQLNDNFTAESRGFVLGKPVGAGHAGARTNVFRARDNLCVRGQHPQKVRRGCKGLKPQQHTQGPLLQILWAFRGQRPARDGYSHSPTRANNVQGKSRTVQGFAQFSTFSPATRLNSRSLLVTSIHPSALAWAAIHRSLLPIV